MPSNSRGASNLYRESACEEFGEETAAGVNSFAVTFVEVEATGIDIGVRSFVCSCVLYRTASG